MYSFFFIFLTARSLEETVAGATHQETRPSGDGKISQVDLNTQADRVSEDPAATTE